MARIPEYQEEPRFRGTDFSAPAPQTQPVDYSSISQVIGQWQQRKMEQEEQKAIQAQKEQAIQQQSELGAGEIAQPDSDIAWRFQQTFKQQAQEVHQRQLALSAQRTRSELSLQYRNDPDGFRQAWETYQQEKTEQIGQRDRTAAAQAKQYLAQQGESTASQLAENAYAREQSKKRAESLSTQNEIIASEADELLNVPNEENYYSYVADTENNLDELVQSGLVDASTAEKQKAVAKDQLTTAFLRGSFQDSLRNEDPEGAQEVIASLRQGAWFDDNDRGRALANQLAQDLEATFKAEGPNRSELVSAGMDTVDVQFQAAKDGAGVDEEQLENAYQMVMQNDPTLSQQQKINRKMNSIFAAQGFRDRLDKISIDQYSVIKNQLEQNADKLEPSMRRELTGLVESKEQEVDEAFQENDIVRIGGKLDIYNDDPQEFVQRKQKVARKTGLEPAEISLYTTEEYQQFDRDLNRALRDGDEDSVDTLLDQFTAPLRDNPRQLAAEVRKLSEAGGETWVLANLAGQGEMLGARDLAAWAGAGRNTDEARLREDAGINPMDLRDDGELNRTMNSLAYGDPSLHEDVENTLYNAYTGLVNQYMQQDFSGRKARGKAKQELKRVLTPFRDTVQLNNGSYLPKFMLPSNEMKNKVNEHLENPRKYFGLPEGMETQGISPMPFSDKSMGFFNHNSGRWVADPDTGEPVQIKYISEEEAAAEQPERPVPKTIQEFTNVEPTVSGESVWEGVKNITDWASQKFESLREKNQDVSYEQQFDSISPQFKQANMDMVKKLPKAVRRTPEEERGTDKYGAGDLAVRASAEKEVRWDKVESTFKKANPGKDFEKNIALADVRPFVAADLFDQYAKKYKGDNKAQIAAYWEGPEVVDQLKEQHGEKWYNELPLDTRKFVRRVINE